MRADDANYRLETANEETLVVQPQAKLFESNNAGALKVALRNEFGSPVKNLVFDAEKIQHMDSYGLATLLSMAKDCRESGGDLVIMSPNSSLLQLVEITRLSSLLKIVDNLQEALSLLGYRQSNKD
jgi:anti-anti-sigma factor